MTARKVSAEITRPQGEILDHYRSHLGLSEQDAIVYLLMRGLETWYAQVIAPEERRKKDRAENTTGAPAARRHAG